MKSWIVAIGAALLCAQVFADEIDISFNADAARLRYVRDLSGSGLQVDGGWLHHTDNGDVLHVGLNLADFASGGVEPVRAGLGGRAYYSNGDLSGQDGFALGVGGFLRYTLPRYNRIAITASAYFAPDVLSLGDVKKFQDYAVSLRYNVLREADVYVGARYVRGDYDDTPDSHYDTGMHVGFNIRF